MKFNSRRSPVYSLKGIVSTSQPLAAAAGIEILKNGGNAADAAVATAAALNVTEPTSTGIGGDIFALYYDAKKNRVFGINGSGRAPKDLTLEKINEEGFDTELPIFHAHTVTVPGAARGWEDTIAKHGTKDLSEILQPAIDLARNGFPVSDLTARSWARGAEIQLSNGPYGSEMLKEGKPPKVGEVMKIPTLADTFERVAEYGSSGFYEGKIAEQIVELLSMKGGVMSLDDLKNHKSTFEDPIKVNYRGVDMYEIAPNGQGITALMALNILEDFDISNMDPYSSEYLHLLIETLRISFADTRWYVADPNKVDVPINHMISKDYAKQRRKLFDETKASIDVMKGSPLASSDTVYLSVIDGEGNACSFIASNYMGFGTGLIPKGCGFTLQNRGHNFSLNPNHPNVIAPEKRPYHTIIPAMATINEKLYASFGVMGGFMQPQGHVQVMLNMIDHGMNPQDALDHPRFCITSGEASGKVAIEEGYSVKTMSELSNLGHTIIPTSSFSRMIFGRGQIITRNSETGVLIAGSDSRADGMAVPI